MSGRARTSLRWMLFLVVAGAGAGASGRAWAYPELQFSSGATRCNQCHLSPAGGGLLTTYGRDAVGDELSTFGGEGALLHGAVKMPSWLALGGDLRGAYAGQDVQDPNGPRNAVFPMQADLSARVAFPLGLSVHATGGFRGQVRPNGDLVPYQNYQPIDSSKLISREHYLMWQPAPQGYYARAGRFFAPFGLRLAEHFTYIRRDLGFNTLEESYNLSGGWVKNASELHATVFFPDFARHIGGNEKGASVYYEHRLLDDNAALAGQVKGSKLPGATRLVGGTVGKYYAPRAHTLFFAEADLVHFILDGAEGRQQLVAAGGASLFPARGVVATFLAERFQDDLRVREAAWTSGTALVSWFPHAHIEMQLMVRAELPGGGSVAKTMFAQLHYFL